MLTADIPFEQQPTLRIGREQLQEKVVVFVLPLSGVLEVVVHELDGTPAPDGTSVRITWADGEGAADPLFLERRPHWNAETRAGSALFSCIELRRSWEASASRGDSDVRSRAQAPGPVHAHEHARLDI